jgi:hypothetical protein
MERRSTCARLFTWIIQVGSPDAKPQAQLSKPLGLPLEIVLERNATAFKRHRLRNNLFQLQFRFPSS